MIKKYLIWVIVALIVVGGIYIFSQTAKKAGEVVNEPVVTGEEPIIPAASSGKPVSPQNSARLVLAIKDKAASFDGIQSILFNIKEIMVLKQGDGWVTISNTPQTFDLVKLKNDGRFVLLNDVKIETGKYNQVRLLLGAIVIMKDGVAYDAKLPSNEMRILTDLNLGKGTTGALTFDVLADKSLHQTGSGKYIFAPVINLKAYDNVTQVQILDKKVDLFGGGLKYNVEAGMNESGEVKVDYSIDPSVKLDLIKNAIIVIPVNEEKNLKVSAQVAIDSAMSGKYLDTVISAKASRRSENNALVWIISGIKDFKRASIMVDAVSGEVLP